MPSSTCAVPSILGAIHPSSKWAAVVAVLFSCRFRVKLTSSDDDDDEEDDDSGDDDERGHQLAVEGRRGREREKRKTKLRGDNPAKKKQTVTQSIENWITTNALSTYLKGKSPGCWGAGGSKRERERERRG